MGERVGGETSAEQVAGAMWDEVQQAHVAGTVSAEQAPVAAAVAAVAPPPTAAAVSPLSLAREAVTRAAAYREQAQGGGGYPAALKAEQGAIALLARVEADAERRAGVRGSREWKEIERVVLEEVGALGAAGQEAARRIAARLRGGAREVGR